MGQSKSKVSNSINNNTLNKQTIEDINKTIMNVGIETLIKNANNCSSSVNQNNLCSVTNINASGDFNFNSDQSNIAKVNFSCVNASETASEMTNNMIQKMMGELNTLSDTSAMAKIDSAANAKNQSSFGATGSSVANVNTNVNNTTKNDTNTIIQNIYENNLKNNFNSETVNECIGKTTQTNALNIGNVTTGGTANIECVQTNTLEYVQECKQLSESLNKTLEETALDLGFKISSENTTANVSEVKSEAISENKSTGIIEDFANGISSILGSVFGLAMAPYIASFICAIIIILCIVSIYFAMSSSSSVSSPISNISDQMSNSFNQMSQLASTANEGLKEGMQFIKNPENQELINTGKQILNNPDVINAGKQMFNQLITPNNAISSIVPQTNNTSSTISYSPKLQTLPTLPTGILDSDNFGNIPNPSTN